MNLYLISQDVETGYDTYDSAVVAAKNCVDAREIHPSPFVTHTEDGQWFGTLSFGKSAGEKYPITTHSWVRYAHIGQITVEYLGKTKRERGVVLASFNAG